MIAYTDASFNMKNKVGGWGVVIQDGLKERHYSSWIPCEDVNYVELFAIYIAGILLEGKGKVYTDSQTAISYIKGEIRDEKPRTHSQYINHQKMRVLAHKINKLNLDVVKIKAHSRVIEDKAINNNIADLYARKGLAKYFQR
jgi:ribonuclease HI